MALTLAQLLSPQDLDQIRAVLLGKLQGKGLPTSDWSSGDPERAFVEMDAAALEDLVTALIPAIAGGNLVDYSTGDWLTLLAPQRFGLSRQLATYTQGNIVLTNPTTSPITVQPNALWFLGAGGNRYNGPVGAGPFVIPASGTLTILVQSESPNHSVATSPADTAPLVSYTDQGGTITTMITSIAGVTCNNPSPAYSSVSQTGTGSGTLTLAGSPSGSHAVSIRIDVSGQSGAALWSYAIDGGAYTSAGAVASLTNLGGLGINVTLINGGGTPSFVLDDVYGFNTPGSWITQQGTDQEPDPTLQTACKNRWPSLATQTAIPGSPTLGFYDLLARQPVAPATTSQVTQTLIQTDPTVNNRVNIYVGGQAGVLPSSVVTALQAVFDALNMITDDPRVLSPSTVAITFGGCSITVKRASLVAAQASLNTAILTYINSVGINGSQGDGKIKHGKIIQLIEDTLGVTDVTDETLTINGVAASLAFPTIAGAVQLPQWSQTAATAFTWITV